MNNYNAVGRIVSVSVPSFKKEKPVLEFLISVNSGQRKKEDEQYPPTFLLKFFVWDKLAEIMEEKAEKGDMVAVSGKLAVPYAYIDKEGDPQASLSLHVVDTLQILASKVTEGDTSGSKKAKAKTTAKSASNNIPEWDPLYEDLF